MYSNILHVNVNQTLDYLSCATVSGFEIYQIQPFTKKLEHSFDGSLSLTHMLYSTNILVCVGGMFTPAYRNSKHIFIWDMKECKIVNYYLCCQPVSSIIVSHRHIIIGYQDHIEIVNLNTCESITKYRTNLQPVSKSRVFNNNSILAFSSKKTGSLRLWRKKKIVEFKSHMSRIIDIHITQECDNIITVSNKHIKRYSIESLSLLHCISIEHYDSIFLTSEIDLIGRFILLRYKNAHIHIFDTMSDDVWTMYFPDIIYSVLLSSKTYPKIFILTKTETKILQLRDKGIITCM